MISLSINLNQILSLLFYGEYGFSLIETFSSLYSQKHIGTWKFMGSLSIQTPHSSGVIKNRSQKTSGNFLPFFKRKGFPERVIIFFDIERSSNFLRLLCPHPTGSYTSHLVQNHSLRISQRPEYIKNAWLRWLNLLNQLQEQFNLIVLIPLRRI